MDTIIHFEDNGQDFLRWRFDENGRMLESYPFQYWMWENWKPVPDQVLKPGGFLRIEKDGKDLTIKHKIERVEFIESGKPIKF